jgi:hypothetical protein
MKTENLISAYHSAQFLAREIRQAHTDATESTNMFAEIALFDLIAESVKLEQKLQRLVDAAKASA